MTEAIEKPKWTFSTDDGTYDVSRLSDDAQSAFDLLIEVNKEVVVHNRRVAVLQASAIQLNNTIRAGLTDEALIEPIEDKTSANSKGGEAAA